MSGRGGVLYWLLIKHSYEMQQKENCNWQRKYQRAIQTCLEKIQALGSWQKLVLSIRQN